MDDADAVINMKTSKRGTVDKTFLETGLTFEWLYKLAMMEANSKRPIYQIHKWWARRLGSVFRTLLIASFADSTDSAQSILEKYNNGHSLTGKIILDPFMGGGTTIIEGLKLGCKVVGVDINPVAWFVTKKEADPFDVEMASKTFTELDQTIGKEIRNFYVTKCKNGHTANILYALWIQKITCEGCGKTIQLFRDYVIANVKETKYVVCPDCNSVIKTRSKSEKIKCTTCGKRFDPSKGVISRGIFKCPHCTWSTKIIDAATKLGEPLPADMFAIEYHCETCGKRQFKKPNSDDLKLYSKAAELFSEIRNELRIPRQKIPSEGRKSQRPITHGYKYFYQLFNDRQLLCLGLLLKQILKIKDQNMREFFILAFSNSLETNNRLCKYESNWGKISALFGIPGYHPVERYGENNVWGMGYGRGTFEKSYKKMVRGKIYASDTYERVYHNDSTISVHVGEKASSNPAKNFDQLKNEKNTLLCCQNSEKLSFLPDGRIDAVVTDPPYFDNIHYCELADFFYVWLRLALEKDYDYFEHLYSSRLREIAAKDDSSEELSGFTTKLSAVFSECSRVLKDDGLMMFTFHHTNPKAWIALKEAITAAKLVITSVPIVRSEGRTGYRKDGSISVDACIVCRKNAHNKIIQTPTQSPVEDVIKQCTSVAQRLIKVDDSLKKADIFTILMGQCLLYDSSIMREITGKSKEYTKDLAKKVGLE